MASQFWATLGFRQRVQSLVTRPFIETEFEALQIGPKETCSDCADEASAGVHSLPSRSDLFGELSESRAHPATL